MGALYLPCASEEIALAVKRARERCVKGSGPGLANVNVSGSTGGSADPQDWKKHKSGIY
jgi:hypothetical protein